MLQCSPSAARSITEDEVAGKSPPRVPRYVSGFAGPSNHYQTTRRGGLKRYICYLNKYSYTSESILRRLIEDEIGDCCDTDVDQCLTELELLIREIPSTTSTDATVLKTLGDETRYRITRLLAAADRELCVCELTPLLDVSDSATSHGLSDLTDTGSVTRHKDGTWRYYQMTSRAEQVLAALDATRRESA